MTAKEQKPSDPAERTTEPAPGGKVITFSLPPSEPPAKPRRRAPRKAEAAAPADFAVYNAEDYCELSTAPRRRAREVSLLLLYAAVSSGDWSSAAQILDDTGVRGGSAAFARTLAEQAYAAMEESDRLLQQYAREWDIERFSSVDRNILRLALAELMREGEAQAVVIINEAIELGKKFGSAESGAFINGILDNIFNQEIKGK